MRLHTFILENMEAILQQWENFAREVWPDVSPSSPDLRDHAQEMLHAICSDLQTSQSEGEQHDKSVGNGSSSAACGQVNSASSRHAVERLETGFEIRALVAEYRALRASVLQLWSQAVPDFCATEVDDMTRFNECIDQLLAESVQSYSECVDQSRKLLLGILGHDLRSPLSAVSLMACLLEETEDLSATSREMASLIVVGTREMKLLVDDLLDFAGSHMGVKIRIKRQSMNLEELSNEVIEEIGAAHPEIVFNFETSGEGNGEWDRPRLRQIISNLLVNAVQHGASETPIRVFMHGDGQKVKFGVCNQGPPIPPDLQAVIFDPLRRFSCNGSSREMKGLGLGLYICREIVKAHGGSIVVSSDESETAFIVKLPRRDICDKNGTHGDEADGPGTSSEPAEMVAQAS